MKDDPKPCLFQTKTSMRLFRTVSSISSQISARLHGGLQGYTFDACIHHLFGCSASSKIYQLWNELGAMPRDFVLPSECTSVLSTDGRLFRDYSDLDRLEGHLNQLSPGDFKNTKEYIDAIRAFAKSDILGDMILGSRWDLTKKLPFMIASLKWFRLTMQRFGERFSDPFLITRRAEFHGLCPWVNGNSPKGRQA